MTLFANSTNFDFGYINYLKMVPISSQTPPKAEACASNEEIRNQ